MVNYVIKSNQRFFENSGFGSIRSLDNYSFPINPSKYALKIKELFIKPSKGILPTSSQGVDIITIPITGTLQQNTNLGSSNVLHKGEVSYLQTQNGTMYYEFNLSEKDEVKCIEIQIQSHCHKREKENNKLIYLSSHKNTLQSVCPMLCCKSQYNIRHGVLGKGKSFEYRPESDYNAVITYVISGSVSIENITTLKENDTYFSSKGSNEFTILPMTDCELLILELN